MPVLQDILYKVSLRSLSGSTAIEVNSIHLDSRTIEKGCLLHSHPWNGQ